VPNGERGNRPNGEPGNEFLSPDPEKPPARKEGVVSDPDFQGSGEFTRSCADLTTAVSGQRVTKAI